MAYLIDAVYREGNRVVTGDPREARSFYSKGRNFFRNDDRSCSHQQVAHGVVYAAA